MNVYLPAMCLALCAVPLCVRTMISDPLVFTHLRWCAVCVCARNPSICRYVRMCVCVCVYMYTCIYIYIYIHTYYICGYMLSVCVLAPCMGSKINRTRSRQDKYGEFTTLCCALTYKHVHRHVGADVGAPSRASMSTPSTNTYRVTTARRTHIHKLYMHA